MNLKLNKFIMSKKEITALKNDLTQKFVIDPLMQKGNLTKESLQPFQLNFDFIQLTQKFREILGKEDNKKKSAAHKRITLTPNQKNQVDWTMKLAVINYLRRLLKFEKEIFNQAFYGLKIYENIIEFLNSIRSILAQNALILINEVLSEYVPELDEKNQKPPIINLVKTIIPVLLLKATTSQSFIKNEAKTCLETMVTYMKYNETLILLLNMMNTKKMSDFELAHTLAIKLIQNLGKEFLVNSNQFNAIMNSLGDIYENHKSDLYKKKCKSILSTFNEIMTKEEFDKKLEKCGKKEKDKIKEILEARVPANTKKEIHNLRLKSKDKSKSVERPKTSCDTKPVVKKQININIKLIDSKQNYKGNIENNIKILSSKENQKDNIENNIKVVDSKENQKENVKNNSKLVNSKEVQKENIENNCNQSNI